MADTFTLLKKNAVWYALSIVVTGLAAFGGIIFTKQNLDASSFVHFNLQLNTAMLISMVALGWFGQSINRFYHGMQGVLHRRAIFNIATVISCTVSIPLFVLWGIIFKINTAWVFPIIFIWVNALQYSFLICRQAALEASQSTLSEIIRSGSIIVFLALPYVFHYKVSETYYWISWISSYALAAFYLFITEAYTSQGISTIKKLEITPEFKLSIKKMLHFGLPLSLWLLCSYVFLYSDRWYLVSAGYNMVETSNYVAVADIMMRGTGFMFSPIVSAAYPLLSRMFDSKDLLNVKVVIIKVIKWEVLMMLGAIIGFLALHKVVFSLLKIKDNTNNLFIWVGVLLLVFQSLWQISAMLHKVAELQLRTGLLMIGNIASLALTYSLFYFVVKPQTMIGVSVCFGAGTIVYVVFCLFLFKYLSFANSNQQ